MPDNAQTETRAFRPPQDNVPQTKDLRERLRQAARDYVQQQQLIGPVSTDELRIHAKSILKEAGVGAVCTDFAAILISNEVWRDTVAAIPYDKRLLLLPRCLRHATRCPAKCDEVGLLCEHCGLCIIDQFKAQAEDLGYAVLIAEGSPVVMSLIETGQIEAVVGVSCLSTLERVYPYMEAGAVPGLAFPLLHDGCVNTRVDTDWLWEALYETTEARTLRLDIESIHDTVYTWFKPESIETILAPGSHHPAVLACQWMAGAGKRWRPFLTACTYEAAAEASATVSQDALHRVAVAVECFHKASLIHDDIEDDDALRYGRQTLHTEFGVPIALNVGDLLLGEGYRLLVENDLAPDIKARLIEIAASAHRTLCLGQGAELAWARAPRPLCVNEILDIFRQKTAPAFAVALKLGAVLAGSDSSVLQVLHDYSQALGTAYQIRDDLDDLYTDDESRAHIITRPSILCALAHEQASPADQAFLAGMGHDPLPTKSTLDKMLKIFTRLQSETQAANLLETFKSQAIGSLASLRNTHLKSLLRRLISKIFYDFDIMGCCNDPKTRHAPRSG